MVNRPPISEAALHKSVVDFLNVALPSDAVWHHSPNETSAGRAWGARMKAAGTRAGWPDLEIFYEGHALFIELKSQKGRLTRPQFDTLAALQEASMDFRVCRSVDEVEEFLGQYMTLKARTA